MRSKKKSVRYLGEDPEQLLGSLLKKMLDDIRYRIYERNKDCFILIVAPLGEGKSTLGAELCSYMDPTFKENRSIFRDYHYYRVKRDLTKGYDPIKNPNKCKCKGILFDEIKRYLLAKESMKREAIKLEMDLNDIRSLGFFMVGCVDELKSATRWLRESRVQIIIYIPRVSECWIYRLYKGEDDDHNAGKLITQLKKRLIAGEYPYTPFKSTFKEIPPNSPFWRAYSKRKAKYQISTNSKISELELKMMEAAEIQKAKLLPWVVAWKVLNTAGIKIAKTTFKRRIEERKIKAIKITNRIYVKPIELARYSKKVSKGVISLSVADLYEKKKEDD